MEALLKMTRPKKLCCGCFNYMDKARGKTIDDKWHCNTCFGKNDLNEDQLE